MNETEDAEELDALLRHCITVYEAMQATATGRFSDEEQVEMVVYEGNLTALIRTDLNFATPYYSKITRALKGMGCCHQLRRGGNTTPSQWELRTAPTLDLYKKYLEAPESPTKSPQRANQQQLGDLARRVDLIERVLQIPTGATIVED